MSIKKPKIIRRKKMTYVLYPEKVIVGVGDRQWISYNQYDNWNRQGITSFRQAILKSGDDEYDNPIDQITLAMQCGIKGAGTQTPKEIKEELL